MSELFKFKNRIEKGRFFKKMKQGYCDSMSGQRKAFPDNKAVSIRNDIQIVISLRSL